jgi:hypothetical protein
MADELQAVFLGVSLFGFDYLAVNETDFYF